MLTIKTILHPTDFSPGSKFAFRLACSLARDYDARLVVLHVGAPPPAIIGEVLVAPPPLEDYEEALRQQLTRLRPKDPKVRVEHRLVIGDAAAEIVREAGAVKADVIVLGTVGRTGLARVFLGSAAEQVVRKAPCPVVTVKAPAATKRPSGDSRPEGAAKTAGAVTG
jgi:nucleotide-binding universal stress UspA family protein